MSGEDEQARDRWENEGGPGQLPFELKQAQEAVKTNIKKIATSWLLPLTLIILLPLILRNLWTKGKEE